jgi:hypothetical protein
MDRRSRVEELERVVKCNMCRSGEKVLECVHVGSVKVSEDLNVGELLLLC